MYIYIHLSIINLSIIKVKLLNDYIYTFKFNIDITLIV